MAISHDETAKRRGVLLAFWAVFLLGLPMWYLTTQVSRAPLPALPTWAPLKPIFPISIQLEEDTLAGVSALAIQKLNSVQDVYHFSTETAAARDTWTVQVKLGAQQAIQFDENKSRTITLTVPATQDHASIADAVAETLQKLTGDERQTMAASRISARASADLRVVNYAPRFNLLFSLMNGGGLHPFLDWPIESVLAETVEPILASIQEVSTFIVESQVQHYAELTFEPKFEEETGEHVLLPSDLSNVINAAEWPLATAEGDAKPLNFIIYVPKPEHRPLVIKQDGKSAAGYAFLLPQFGSVVIYNPPANETSKTMDKAILATMMETCTSHFLTLIGMSPRIAGWPDHSLWRRDAFYRARLMELIRSAQQTLASIPKMVDALPNMHVPEQAAARMAQALTHVDAALLHTTAANDYDLIAALRHARQAVAFAEAAFFDDKMVSLLYFPQEHKYGVYMPLFGPLLLPLGLSLLREIKGFLVARRVRRSTEAKKVQ
ncbi:phosphatidylinositol-glycan biosynthesis class S protein [Protomyces lactucae-debilis]|uniref:Phosphatidylinositol-glycan biosynthesis class S protein n=1 Tax=Protomyces lactucae-debilis TaxID=2754530 RepID=A0A1Y2FQR1_PROLT|nr:phosphatidylinositol-glycan biosynthesis class S protein [Protomyces lactucae-debilis]ORY86318.1 phosphatidylinositol-glycan biosynthesis class S protein [Protomyces lactucae-debilis]